VRASPPPRVADVANPQPGIFAVGNLAHAYLEFDLAGGTALRSAVEAVVGLRTPGTTMAGINVVSGFRPEAWRDLVPSGIPRGVTGFNREIRGTGGFVMPATQHDVFLWLAGGSIDSVFDAARNVIRDLSATSAIADEQTSWPYHHDRDLTGFIDGTENPPLIDAPRVALLGDGTPGAGGSVLLIQKWRHEVAAWESLSTHDQEQVIGRAKVDSTELEPKPPTAHAARADQDVFGEIFRRNMPYGTTTRHGTMFVGFSADQTRLSRMLESMAGSTDGIRDALTLYATPLTGAYYFVPSTDALTEFEGRAAPASTA
jgi:porphyrinogen peroxidase